MAQSQVKRDPLIVVSFDIGTTFSGYAYSVRDHLSDVITNQTWIAGGRSLASLKTPTCLLLNQKQEFDAFGYDAENKYASLAEDDIHHGWYFFQWFKMALCNDKNLSLETVVDDITGRSFPAITVFSMTIKYLKDHLMRSLQQRLLDITFDDVDVVLTVPAIWNDKAKQFMREAANRAGIENDQLKISLEPEAASIWCQNIKTEVKKAQGRSLGITSLGARYMIVDIGGGTADITVHKKRFDGTLKEIHTATGGPWGGIEVDKAFIQLLINIVGEEVMKTFQKENMADYLDLLRDFELKKRSISGETTGKIVIKIPISLKDVYDESGQSTIADIERRFGNKVEWKGDKMRIQSDLIKECFKFSVSQLTLHVRGILLERRMQAVDRIMLVGGFAECALVQEAFNEHFKDKQIVIPAECGTVVLKGAVLFGHNSTIISTRIARFSYGLAIIVPFDKRVHPREHFIETNIGDHCQHVFWKAVELEQPLPIGHVVTRVGRPGYDYQSNMMSEIYRSSSKNPHFVTDESCELIGCIKIKMNSETTSLENKVDEMFIFGDTEVKYSVKHRATGTKESLYLTL